MMAGIHISDVSLGEETTSERAAVTVTDRNDAEIVAACGAAIAPAWTVNPADRDPEGIVTETGSVRLGRLSESVITAPPDGAALESVAVHVVLAFAARLAAAHFRLVSLGGVTRERTTVLEEPFREAVMVAV
jgi:hypothetical protein